MPTTTSLAISPSSTRSTAPPARAGAGAQAAPPTAAALPRRAPAGPLPSNPTETTAHPLPRATPASNRGQGGRGRGRTPRNRGGLPALVVIPEHLTAPDEEGVPLTVAEHLDDDLPYALVQKDGLIAQLSRDAKATGTRASYQAHWGAFVTWCEQRGLPSLPTTPQVLLLHLSRIAVLCDDDDQPVPGPDGELQRGLHPSTVQVRLHAIDHHQAQAGHPRLAKDEDVRTLMHGLCRRFGVAPDEQRTPVDLDELPRLLVACHRAEPELLLRAAAPALATHLDLTAGQLRRLDWPDVHLVPGRPRLRLAPPTRSTRRQWHDLPRDLDPAVLGMLADLKQLAGGSGPVMRHRGKRMSDQGIRKLLESEQPPAPAQLLSAGLRDEVLLLLGWWSALRRDNLSCLRWGHLDLRLADTEGVVARIPRSKTDQAGEGNRVGLMRVDEAPSLCPVRALQRWREHLSQVLGYDPVSRPELPVLLEVDRNGKVRADGRQGLSGKSINIKVQELADRCGLTVEARAAGQGQWRHPYGAHSLRAGWLSSYFRRGGSLQDGRRHLLHVKLDTTLRYYREHTVLTRNANRTLLNALAQQPATARPAATVQARRQRR